MGKGVAWHFPELPVGAPWVAWLFMPVGWQELEARSEGRVTGPCLPGRRSPLVGMSLLSHTWNLGSKQV